MGHGWKTIGSEIKSRRPCNCGKGEVIVEVEIQESDFSFTDREANRTIINSCPDKCE